MLGKAELASGWFSALSTLRTNCQAVSVCSLCADIAKLRPGLYMLPFVVSLGAPAKV